MHQGHNIPWNILSSNFRFVFNDTRFTPPKTSLILNSKDQTRAHNELKHFIHKFEHAIRTFSQTERSKYPPTFEPLLTGKLFSDGLRDKYPEYLNSNNQDIEYWIRLARINMGCNVNSPIGLRYTTSHARLAEVIKILLHENQMSTLLMLAQHPSIPLADLHQLSWGHHFGFSRVKESALRVYIFFNAAEATGILENGKYADMRDEYYSLLSEIANSMDYPAQQIPHREFLRECGVLGDVNRRSWVPYGAPWKAEEEYVHVDYAHLQEYLKMLFALMYRYDVLLRECGVDPEWGMEIANCFPLRGNVKTNWNESQQKWVLV
ncbi:hypothetical protein CVT25_004916 [Psilocybe cyanescens]|uniref:Uncharacterized protein n=1 Tax=Psilocybe cyanescens TaxID=93625 RepID=A0A409XU47_PSICY|nr:hypothetical protein CVT25_004916 [Psilocybe cyanescens]